ncbi:hypothetical protein EA658_05545 [Pseudoxanthomonas winnipegensis]|jgi:hypothetical protein|uniref:DUF2971 domain-containing protein n=1 Tax=Pseudoxanthomonas winnipegensis TaxID=2480810 RepID=A0ABY1WK60_9GAMM|nr:DUF2971 domain-containing protein [Pseudoxanthomonas winnipegensis]TAA09606.1 hypothetical protein EA659_08385 [Pseudoxanthomonas winnipegensis]TAA23017.1 hypothetical protein EA658_05545 [Pseudoxanthomonas winnipegensis]TAH73427.1 hypothetical protein EA657_07075 [Pseudoxanthomonas winnipegensis]
MLGNFHRDPKPERIYHYTTLESLAYILSTRRLRFSRLDMFDDVHEAQKFDGYNFGSMIFASSWVANPEETYPQWAMYGDKMRGVRISLSPQPFFWSPYEPQNGDYADRTCIPMPMSEAITDDYKVFPFIEPGEFLDKVVYVQNVAECWRKEMQVLPGKLMSSDPRILARYKNERWKFQKEHRFVLMATGRPVGGATVETSRPLVPSATHIDVPLAATAFEELEVSLGPLRSHATRLIAEALLEKHAPEAKLAESELYGEVRARGG